MSKDLLITRVQLFVSPRWSIYVIHTYTHIYIYMYIHIYVCVCVSIYDMYVYGVCTLLYMCLETHEYVHRNQKIAEDVILQVPSVLLFRQGH